jgi:hypothetical protein
VGLASVDYFQPDNSESPENEYRPCDPFDIIGVTNDFLRSQYVEAGVSDYALARAGAGAWLSYTRTFPDADYQVHLRADSPDGRMLALDLVELESGGGQTLVSLGRFQLTGLSGQPGYSVLVDEENEPVVLTLNDVQTLRLTVLEGEGDAGLNFLVFVPVPRIATPLVTDLHPASNATNAAPDTIVSLRIENRETSLVASSLMLILDETDVTADVLLEPDSGGTTVTYQPPELLLPGTTHVARIVSRATTS